MNLKEIVLRSNIYGTCHGSICVKGPGYVTAQDIILPPCVEIVMPYSCLFRNANHSIHSYRMGMKNKRYFFSKYGQMGVSLRKKHFMKPLGI
ncbi:hypothetical protein Leryth_026502 [Lithospermum erythrorhizon]|nr:hypothetical protein Leryth_026502 [Lithospermum erythrorhizon]